MANKKKKIIDFSLNNKTVLITGGTGSFGKSFSKYLLDKYSLKKLIVFSRDEYKQYYMEKEIKDERLRFFIGDVRDLSRLQMAFKDVDVVVHAAALKQVPTIEYNPFEAVKTNILGTQNVIEASIAQNVSKAVLISTDKAVLPLNLYGATKLTSEKLFISGNSYSPLGTRFSVVRYGNVVGSRGSIVEVLMNGKLKEKVQITDTRMTRFWLALEKSFDLVLFSLKHMEGGEIFIPKVPSMKLVDLFDAFAPNTKIEVIGIRPGEKLHEVLITNHEASRTLDILGYYVILPEYINGPRNYKKYFKTGKKVPSNFSFVSDENDEWLSKSQIIKMAGVSEH